MVVGRVYDVSKSRNALMQSLNQGSQPLWMRTRWSQLSAGRLRLRNVQKCCFRLLEDCRSSWSLLSMSCMLGGFTFWRLRKTFICLFSKWVTLTHLKKDQWYWSLKKQGSSFFRWTNTLKSHNLHGKAAEGKTHSCSWFSRYFSHGLKYVSTNFNLSSFD